MSRQNHKAKGNGKAAEYVKVYRFMTEGMGLQGTLLLVYARIFGFCKETGGSFWESRRGTAEFLGISVRQVNRDMRKLEEMFPAADRLFKLPAIRNPGVSTVIKIITRLWACRQLSAEGQRHCAFRVLRVLAEAAEHVRQSARLTLVAAHTAQPLASHRIIL
ncbi:MAG: hypothetical protein LKH08_05195 [Atopobiaceae bacterium]|jgi:hypothetical protein|nr:hypothetical protein [Atopobiaceae bacterium]MCH4120373.1 hypothetical protein [Atopobiaceae bacterium]MCI1389417.1 hypothetical protein [Atopobiaceae bacterium]MCI1432302.1 hypothetical protein [Atopobiaceae bacterium]MCI1470760.1 hypothetical protein [Atopobiaceae bacterium]